MYLQLPNLKSWGAENSFIGSMFKLGLLRGLFMLIKCFLKAAYELGILLNIEMVEKYDKVFVFVKLIVHEMDVIMSRKQN